MKTKAELTSQYIIETVSPVFIRNGYIGTSLSDITSATGLTKGAIYGNFENKEDLALKVFHYVYRKMIGVLKEKMSKGENGLARLYLLCDFYRNYYDYYYDFGGCPVLNLGVDSQYSVPGLEDAVKHSIMKLQLGIERMILEGQTDGTISSMINAKNYSSVLFSIIQGGIFTSFVTKNRVHLYQVMDFLKQTIRKEIAS